MLDFRLKVFYTVASEKSFTKAAHKHNITQPAVSKHIQELERIYGITLFERRGSSILLTEAGRILYEQAKNIDEIYREIDYRISSLKEKSTRANCDSGLRRPSPNTFCRKPSHGFTIITRPSS